MKHLITNLSVLSIVLVALCGRAGDTKSTPDTQAQLIMKSKIQQIHGVRAQFVVFHDKAEKHTLRLEIEAVIRNFPSDVRVEAYSSAGKPIPTKFATSGSTSWATNIFCGFYEFNLAQGVRLGYVMLTWKNVSEKFILTSVTDAKPEEGMDTIESRNIE